MAKRALTVNDIRAYNPTLLPFDGDWLSGIGMPERTGSWIVWGNSANGKTRFALQLAKYLCRFGKVAYDSLEEGLSLSMQRAIADVGFSDAEQKRNFILLDKEPIDELIVRLKKQRSPQIVIIDSLQYTGMSYTDYKMLRDSFRNKLFIFISHADGKEPKGNVGKAVRYDAFVKIYVEGYKAMIQSRYGGGAEYIIWETGATQYWG
ncbi:MAG: hypothetical protein NC038_05605 [Paludibacter sp.]|nr:hypothetical protein [Bacteroidales bacterium]MCM1069848.1 hypothetical protein [Prevotella sp.]MCM1353959.1 hypothetical protein [Bacteroides sp.]MCM1443399.1 hypothetical protein [Muribaculum sp.]MCM1482102.1 hypothetical protein [Paludibacter sp.]